MQDILKFIPGFRSDKKYKKIIALIYYVFFLIGLFTDVGLGLFFLSMPFIFFYTIGVFKDRKKSLPLKKSLLPLVVSLGIAIIGISISSPTDYAQTEGQLIVEDEDATSKETSKAEDTSKEEDTPTQESLVEETKSEESKETAESEEVVTSEDDESDSKDDDRDKIEETTKESTKDNQDNSSPSGKLEVHFIDVGQGDASLLICDGQVMLIDGGNPGDSNLIYTYLKKHNIKHIDYMVNTHPHADHVGGLAGALNYATVGKAFSSATSYDSKAFDNFVKYLNEQNVSITVPKASDKFKLGSATVEILSGRKKFNDANNDSIVLKVTYGDTSFLFTGDAEREAEQALLDSGANLSSTVLHVGHHGSDTSTTYPFLRAIMPKYGVISVGKNNSYGHPTEEVLSKLRDADVKVLRTDMQGDIIFTSDGRSVSYITARNRDVDTLGPASKETKPTPGVTKQPETQAKETTSPTTEETTQVVESTVAPTNPPKDEKVVNPVTSNYILNTNTKKFHYPSCSSVKRMSDKNKQESNLSRDEIISQGYDPCGICKP